MPWGRFRCHWRVSEHAGAGSVLGECLGLGRSVASVSASASGPGGRVERSVVERLAQVDLPRLRPPAFRVPRVEADEVVTDEGDGHEQGLSLIHISEPTRPY